MGTGIDRRQRGGSAAVGEATGVGSGDWRGDSCMWRGAPRDRPAPVSVLGDEATESAGVSGASRVMNGCCSSCEMVARSVGSFLRHCDTKSLNSSLAAPNDGAWEASDGGGSALTTARISARWCSRACGGAPSAISTHVMPSAHTSPLSAGSAPHRLSGDIHSGVPPMGEVS